MSVTNIDRDTTREIIQLIKPHVNRFASLNSLRQDALNELERLGLPAGKSEEYRYTPLTRFIEKGFDLSQPAQPGAMETKRHDIDGLDAFHIVFVNGVYDKAQSSTGTLENVEISPIEEVAEKNPDALLPYFAKFANYKADAFTALNTASWTGGVYVHVKEKAVVPKPIVVHTITDATQSQALNAVRNLIVVSRNSEVTVVHQSKTIGTNANFTSTVTEVVVKENAGFHFYQPQVDKGKPVAFNQTTIYQESHSRVNCYTFTLDGKIVRNNLQLILDGEGCDSHMYGLYLLNDDTLADNHTVVDHQKPNSFSNELYKGVMNGSSKGVFNGKIYVRPQAQKTNAFQANKNIILTDKASVNTKPQLEIWADDVKCSHGCTSGQLDEEALFYLQARGINKDTAQAMLLYAFAGEVLEHVKIEAIKTYLDKEIGDRLGKTF